MKTRLAVLTERSQFVVEEIALDHTSHMQDGQLCLLTMQCVAAYDLRSAQGSGELHGQDGIE